MPHPEPPQPAATPRRFVWRRLLQYRLRTLLILMAAFAVFAVSGWLVRVLIQTVGVMKHADLALRATSNATNAVEKYVRKRGEWPTSWKDLESDSAANGTGPMPVGWDEIRTYVEIDFDLTLDQVAKQRLNDFSAIKPKNPEKPLWANHRQLFIPLLETVRNFQNAKSGRVTAPKASNADTHGNKAHSPPSNGGGRVPGAP